MPGPDFKIRLADLKLGWHMPADTRRRQNGLFQWGNKDICHLPGPDFKLRLAELKLGWHNGECTLGKTPLGSAILDGFDGTE